jgi:hypothetical protein
MRKAEFHKLKAVLWHHCVNKDYLLKTKLTTLLLGVVLTVNVQGDTVWEKEKK